VLILVTFSHRGIMRFGPLCTQRTPSVLIEKRDPPLLRSLILGYMYSPKPLTNSPVAIYPRCLRTKSRRAKQQMLHCGLYCRRYYLPVYIIIMLLHFYAVEATALGSLLLPLLAVFLR